MNKRIIACMALLLTLLTAHAQKDDFGLWTSAGVTKKINKQWSVGAEAEFRTRDGFATADRWAGELDVAYKPLRWLKADVAYKFIDSHYPAKDTYHSNGLLNKHTPGYWTPRHRFSVSLTGTVPVGNFRFSLRERWQYTYRPEKTVQRWDDDDEEWSDKTVGGKAKNVLRSRLQAEWKTGSRFTPYASVELFNAMSLQKTRYALGTEVRLSKQHTLDVGYKYQNVSRDGDAPDPNTHVVSIGYKFKF